MVPDSDASSGSAHTAAAWVRRLVIAAAIALGAWLLVVAASRSETSLDQGSTDPIVAERFPLPDAQAPTQSQVGITLQPGYEGSLHINGVEIPEEQVDGALDPATADPEAIKQFGIRPNNRNRIWFTPGSSKVFTELPTGRMLITVHYHRDRQPGVEPGTVSWVVTVV